MALDQGALKAGLMDLTSSFPATHADAGQRWAAAYSSYAGLAKSHAGGIPSVALAQATLGGLLASAFASNNAASAMDAAFVAFWIAPPIRFAGAFLGVVTAVPSVVGFAAVFAQNISGRASKEAACDAIAAAIHAFTSTVICTDATVPTPTVGPIR